MALRDQPYLPLYVQDFLTDEKLNNCTPSTQGVYIKIMCLFHKFDPYGGILLEQKDKQNDCICLNFARKLSRQLPFDTTIIVDALNELLEERVLLIDGDFLYQKRMVKDNGLSNKRSEIGREGGKKAQSKNINFAQAKSKANTEDENENENEVIIEEEKGITKGKNKFAIPTIDQVVSYCNERQNSVDPITWHNFYSSKGWMIGKNKMKDWKAAVRTWENNQTQQNGTTKQKQLGNLSSSGVSDDYKQSILNRLLSAGSSETMPGD